MRCFSMMARRRFFMNAGCVGAYDEGTDGRMVAYLGLPHSD